MSKPIKTMTLSVGDDPVAVVCPGHVDQKTFNQAFKNEGWDSAGYKQNDLEYIYAIHQAEGKGKKFKFKITSPSKPGAKKFTYTKWD